MLEVSDHDSTSNSREDDVWMSELDDELLGKSKQKVKQSGGENGKRGSEG